jgi:sporulation protein YlmC with PRC-barrel domain
MTPISEFTMSQTSHPRVSRSGDGIDERKQMKQTELRSDAVEYQIGSEVSCSDGVCGELKRVIVDPVAVTLTHLVVETKHRQSAGHLVPIDLVSAADAEKIQLHCTTAEFQALGDAEETRLLPVGSELWGYRPDQMRSLPYYALAGGDMGGSGMGMGMGALGMTGMGPSAGPRTTVSDRVPAGEVEVRRGDRVQASDGAIGHVQGLAIDPSDHQVTHVLLDEGHLWGKKRVAIPIGAVTRIDDDVQVNLTKDQIGDLPAVELDDSK